MTAAVVAPEPRDVPPEHRARRRWRGDVLALVLLVLSIVAACAYRWRFDNWLSDFDMLSQYIPWFTYLGESLRDQHIPAWNSHESSGTPFAASPASGWLYLPVMLTFTLVSGVNGYKLYILVLALTAGISTYAFSRKIGLGVVGSLVAALSLAIGPFLYSATNYYAPNAQITPVIPVGLLFSELALQSKRLPTRIGFASLGGITLATMYTGSPPRFMYGALFVGAWILWRWITSHRERTVSGKHLAINVMTIGLAMGMTAAGFVAGAFLPQWQYQATSSIAGADYSNLIGADYVASRNSWATIIRHVFAGQSPNEERSFLCAAALVVLALFAVTLGRRRFGIPVFLVVTLAFVDLSANHSLTRPIFYVIPGFEHINSHRPTSSQALFLPAFSMLAGIGMHLFIATVGKGIGKASRWIPLAGFLAITVVARLLGVWIGWWQLGLGVAMGMLVLLAAPSLFRLRRPGVVPFTRFSVAVTFLMILVFPTGVDIAGSFRHPSGAPEWENLLTKDTYVEEMVNLNLSDTDPFGAGEVLKSVQSRDAPFRYASYFNPGIPGSTYQPSAERRMDPYIVATLANARANALGLEQISGYNAVHSKSYVEYIDAMNQGSQDYHWLDVFPAAVDNSQLLSMLNVRFVLVPANLGTSPPIVHTWEEVFRNDLVIMYQNPGYFERVWMVHDVQPNNDGEGLAKLADGSVDGHVTAFVDVDGELPPVTPLAEGAEPDYLTIVDRADGLLKVKTASSQDGLLVISQAYDDGWVAYVDGVKTNIIRTDHALQGVPLSAGEHSVDLKYEPEMLAVGLRITLATSIGVLVVWLWALFTTTVGYRVVLNPLAHTGTRVWKGIEASLRARALPRMVFRAVHRSWLWLARSEFGPVSLMLLVTLGAIGIRWYFDNWLADWDPLTQFLPWYGEIGDRVRAFEVPAWNPHDSSGAPFAGSPANGWMYLPVMVAFALLEVTEAYKFYVFLLSAIAGIATYFLGRRLGLNRYAAMVAGIVFAIGPLMYGSTMYGTPTSQVTPFIAVGILGAENAIRSRRSSALLGWSGLTGIALAQMYTGSPPRFMYGAICIVAWYGYRWLIEPVPEEEPRWIIFRRSLISGAFAAVIGAMFGAAAILPQLDFQSESNIAGGDYSNVVGGDYVGHFRSWLGLARLYLRGTDLSERAALHAAPVVLLGVLACVLARRKYGVPYFAFFTFAYLDLQATPSFTRPIFYLIPGFETINSHRPTSSSALFFFATALLAGAGIQALADDSAHSPSRRRSIRLKLAPLAIFLAIVLACRLNDIWIGWMQVGLAIATTILFIVPDLRRSRLSPRALTHGTLVALLALILIFPTGVDLVRSFRNPEASPTWENPIARDRVVSDAVDQTAARRDPGTAAEFLQDQQALGVPFRYVSFSGTADNPFTYQSMAAQRNDPVIIATLANARATRLGLEQISGYNAVHLAEYVDYINVMNGQPQDYHYLDAMTPAVSGSPLLDMLNVRYVLVPARLDPQPLIAEFGTVVYQDDLVIVYENPDAFARAWMVHDVQPAQDGAELELLNSGQVDGRVTAFVDGKPPAVALPAAGDPPDVVQVTDRTNEMLKFTVVSSTDGFAVISQPYTNGWNAYLDGEKVELFRTNHALQGVAVTAGTHEIILRYEPQSLTIGLWSTGTSVVVLLVVWCWALVDRWKRRTAHMDEAVAGVALQSEPPINDTSSGT